MSANDRRLDDPEVVEAAQWAPQPTGQSSLPVAPLACEQLALVPSGEPMDAAMVEALAEADAGTDPWWRSGIDQAIEALARTGRPFSADDTRALGVGEPDRPNSWGAPFRSARARGVIEVVAVGPSSRRERHHGLRRLWRGTASWRDQEAS